MDKAPLEAHVVLLLAECDLEREGMDRIEGAMVPEELSGDERAGAPVSRFNPPRLG